MEIIDINTCIGVRPEDDRPLDLATLQEQMARAGVAYALCTHSAAIRFHSQAGNAKMLQLAQDPHLYPVAVVNPAPYVGVTEEIALYARQGFKGLRFIPHQQNWSLASEPFQRALEAAASFKLPCIVEVSSSGDATLVGLLAREVAIPVILANVTYATMGEAIAVLETCPNLYLELCRLVTPGIVELLAERLGDRRLLFGSGAPAWEIVPTLQMIQHADISPGSKARLLGENAQQTFHLGD
ncbi:MAG: amidohydrolase family protein [Anaerolineae bacterium]|nr:amidohydrolase family protein [Anaerolineae bacterium]